jgi:TusA-related sulfurtransferase
LKDGVQGRNLFMPDTKPKAQLDLEDLALHEGATVLLRRELTQLGPGEWLEVRGDSAELAEHLVAWCRREGHRLESLQGVKGGYRIQAAAAVPSQLTSRLEVSEIAEPSWGLAPRGA